MTRLPSWPRLIGFLAALALVPSSALAAAGTHTTLGDFQQNVRADVLLEPFNGAAQDFFAAYPVTGNGYSFEVQPAIRRDTAGIGSISDALSTQFVFTGRPVSAFAGTFRVLDHSGVSIGGTVNVMLSTGETFVVTVPVAGAFFGVTSTQPFTSVSLDSPLHSPPASNATFERIDDVYVGTSGTAAAGSDQCDDAPTICPTTGAQYPFTTVGATAQPIGNACDNAVDTGPDIWFRLVPTSTGLATITTCGADFDTILRVFGSCIIAGSGQHLACNDDYCTGGGFMRASRVQLRVNAGEDYLIRISGYSGASGSGTLTFSIVPDCAGDFNHNGARSVQDLFDFLAAWFGACP